MAKAASPLRIDDDLMQAAKQTGKLMHRSAAQQIEYWASIGRRLQDKVDPEILLRVDAGLITLRPESVTDPVINVDDLLAEIDTKRESGELSNAITKGQVRYQASPAHPGMLEMIEPDGTTTIGQFVNGQFEAQ